MLTLCEEFTRIGHQVRLYNNPYEQNASPFEQKTVWEFDPDEDRDILVVFRTPNRRALKAKGKRVWFSCDQSTMGSYKEYAQYMDKVVCISPFHAQYFKDTYDIEDTVVIPIPIRINDFEGKDIEKVKNRIIFTSVPDRGLQHLWRMWPILLEEVRDLSLVITSDYRLWNAPEARNAQHRIKWMCHDNVSFLGALPRARMIEEVLKAQILLYPCSYYELQCLAVGEAMVAGCYPITSAFGALETTNFGTILRVDPSDPNNDKLFIDETLKLINDPTLLGAYQRDVQKVAKSIFSPEIILEEWRLRIFNG